MASILDVGLSNFFIPIFVFLLVFVGLYALLEKTKILGDNKGIHAIVAFVIALIVTISKPITNFLIFVIPWFFILILILLVFIFIGKMFGKTDKDVQWAFTYGTKSPVVTWVVICCAIIIVVGFTNLGGQELLEQNPEYQPGSNATMNPAGTGSSGVISDENLDTATPEYEKNALATLIHPKVLGMIVLIIVGLASILLLTTSGFAPRTR